MTILMLVKDIVLEKMFSSPILLMNSYIINFVLLHTEEPSNSYNFYVKITTFKAKISLGNNPEIKDKLILSMLPQGNSEVYSKSCVEKSSMFQSSYLISSCKLLKFLLKKTKKHLCVLLSLRISVKWRHFSLTQLNLIKKALNNSNSKLFKRSTSKVSKLFFLILKETIRKHLLHWTRNLNQSF